MKYTPEQLESMMVKARLLGKVDQLNTKCGHTMYLIKDISDGVNILYIPDDVETAEEKDRIGTDSCPTYCEIKCKKLIVYGGKNLKDANSMFNCCLAESIDLSSFDTSKVTSMRDMFDCCRAHYLDLSNFDTSNVTDMSGMFSDCLAESLDLSSFDTSNVTTMDGMFFKCKAQSLDLSNFDTSSVISMSYMFCQCEAQSIDLTNFDTSNVTDMEEMFYDCHAEVKATDPDILAALNER